MEFYFLPFNFLLFFSFLSLDRQLVDFTYPSFLLFKFLKSKEWMEQWKWYNQISTSKSNVLEKRKKHKQRSFVLLDSLPYSNFSARNQRFHTFTKKFFTSFFFRTAGQDTLSKLEQFFDARRVWRGGRIYIGGEPATIKFKIYDDTFAASKVALNFRYA